MNKKASKFKKVYLFDKDEFYGITLDMILYNFHLDSAEKIIDKNSFHQFNRKLCNGDLDKNIYLVDELIESIGIDVKRLLEDIKRFDKNCVLIGITRLKEIDIQFANLYDYIIVKSGRSNENTLVKTLSKIFDIEFVADNSDPEYS